MAHIELSTGSTIVVTENMIDACNDYDASSNWIEVTMISTEWAGGDLKNIFRTIRIMKPHIVSIY